MCKDYSSLTSMKQIQSSGSHSWLADSSRQAVRICEGLLPDFSGALRCFRRPSPVLSEAFSGAFGGFLRSFRRLSPELSESFSGAFGDFLRSFRRLSPEHPETFSGKLSKAWESYIVGFQLFAKTSHGRCAWPYFVPHRVRLAGVSTASAVPFMSQRTDADRR